MALRNGGRPYSGAYSGVAGVVVSSRSPIVAPLGGFLGMCAEGAVGIAAPPRAERLEGYVETAPWKRPCWKLSSPLVSKPP